MSNWAGVSVHLTWEKGYYIFRCEKDRKEVPRKAGFTWHPVRCTKRYCKICKAGVEGGVWVTNKNHQAIRLVKHADPIARTYLLTYQESVKESLEMSRAHEAEIEIPRSETVISNKWDYKGYQKAGVKYALQRETTLIADEPGLGKSIQAVGVINALPDAKKVLVLCPASLRLNWEREMKNWLTKELEIFVVEKDLPAADDNFDVLIINYDKFSRNRKKEFADFCKKYEWDVLIADESTALKEPSSARSQEILGYKNKKGIIQKARKTLFLTGTPILNRPKELWPILHAALPKQFDNFYDFADRYCDRKWNGYGWDTNGFSNTDELQELLRTLLMVRRTKEEVLKDLPPKIRQAIVLPSPNTNIKKLLEKERKAFSKVEKQISKMANEADTSFIGGDREGFTKKINGMNRRQAEFNELSKLRKELAVAKIPLVLEFVENALEESDKVVVFAHHREVCEAIRDHFKNKTVLLYGGMDPRAQDEAVQRFQTEEKIKVFVGSIMAASMGHTLTASSRVIFAEIDWVPAMMVQCEDRCHRLGQKDTVLSQMLVLDNSVDSSMAKTLIKKQEEIDKALDEKLAVELQNERDEGDIFGGVFDKKVEIPETPVPVAEAEVEKDLFSFRETSEAVGHTEILGGAVRLTLNEGYNEAVLTPEWECSTAPRYTQELKQVAKKALNTIMDMEWLKAHGFDRYDGFLGRSLAQTKEELTDKQFQLARKLALKYRNSLPNKIVKKLEDAESV